MSGRRHPPPTGVLAAIRDGAKMAASDKPRVRIITPVGGVSVDYVNPEEPSTPTNISQGDRIEWRQQTHQAGLEEIGRVLGEIQAGQDKQATELHAIRTDIGTLAKLAEKDDARKEKREERENEERKDARKDAVALANTKMSSREKIFIALLATIGTIGTAVTTYALTRPDDDPPRASRRQLPSTVDPDTTP